MKTKMFMLIALLLAVFTVLTACSGKKTTQTTNNSTPGTSQGGNNDGGNTAGWAATFKEYTGISNLPIPSNCEVDTGNTSSRTVTFTAKAEVTEDEFKAYAEQVFDMTKSAFPDGNYGLSDTYTKGDAYGIFADVPSSSKMTYWY
jgi:major membrane immunogen (membrane-anchored lipoprotein)